MDVADGYVTFVRHSQDMLREKINEEVYTERLFEVSSFRKRCFDLQDGGVKIKLQQLQIGVFLNNRGMEAVI